MAREVMHIRKSSSWWDGSATTLCGIKIPDPVKVWFPSLSSNPKCPACIAAHQGR